MARLVHWKLKEIHFPIKAGIHTFRDNDELPRGEDISSRILKSIQESKISLVVFSKGYASSTWCLDELAKIMECKSTFGQIVLPIFYDIDPAHVLKQKGSFAEAFGTLEERFKEEIDKVNKWKGALVEAANLSGWDLHSVANGHESSFVQKIVEEVSSKLNHKFFNVAKHPVGVGSHVKDIIPLLGVGSDDVRIVGIYGMPGVGKTTLAKALFNQLCHRFEGSSCLLNIKGIAEQPNGLVQLQEQLLYRTLKQKSWIYNVDQGIIRIKGRFCRKRVLVVLDDVDQLEQLNALVGERSWFGPSSRIIITTRDEHLLTQIGVEKKYQAKELNHAESLQLFSWHAFGQPNPEKDYFELSKVVIDYVGGIPLALEVLGSYLFKRSITEWRSAIEKLRKIPDHQIQKHLRTSFDSLDDDNFKDLFLDIACFFIGMDKEYAANILDARGFFSEISLSILKERSLVTINGENKLQMHNLLRDMGREIIRQMSPKHPGKRSRLWSREDVLDVLIKITGTELVEGLVLDVQASEYVALSSESFARMRCLQLLQCNGVHISGCYERLPKELTWLCWHKCPLESLPPEFQLDNLVVLDMQHSLIRNVWEGLKFLNKLKIINLSHSVHLVKTPDFTGLSNLERLILEGCTSLVDVDHSIGHLESLVFLNLEGCRKLDNLPESICHLKSLETLNIIECSRIRMLPEHFGKLKNLRYLLFGSSIKEFLKDAPEVHHAFYKTAMDLCVFAGDTELFKLESSLSSQIREKIYSTATHSEETITKIQTLLPASFVGLSSMRRLDLRYRELSNINTSINFGSLSSLQDLNLAGNNFFTLPMGIGCLPKLEKLNLCCCRSLLWISELPPSLKTLEAYDCTLMKRISIRSKIVPDLLLGGCMNLVEIEGLENMVNKPVIYMEDCLNLSNKFKKTLLQVLLNCKLPDTVFPGSAIPYWFSHRRESPLTFCLPPISSSEIQGLIVWAVYSNSRHKFIEEDFFLSATVRKKSNGTELLDLFSSATIREKSLDRFSSATIRIKSNGTELFYGSSYFPMFSDSLQDHSWVIYIPSGRISCATLEGGEEMEVSIRVGADAIVSKCGVHLVLNQPEVLDSQGSVLIMEIERQPWFLRNLPEEFSESSEAIY